MSGGLQPVSCGYYDPFDVFPKLQEGLTKRVQLTNLHWRKTSKDGLRSIPQLPLKFVEEKPKIFDNSSFPVNLSIAGIPEDQVLEKAVQFLEVPYIRLMLIECDSSDTYKSQVRPLIKEWHKGTIEKSNGPVDWYLIFYIPDSESSDSKSRTKVFEKLKLDFNVDDSDTDRCIKLKATYTNPLEENESWNLLVNKLKNGVLYSLTERLSILRNELMLLENDRSKLISNLSLYFALKEGYAKQFLSVHLFEDALGEYDHLAGIIKEFHEGSEYFRANSLDVSRAKSTDLIQLASSPSLFQLDQKEISLFHLKTYVFAKQFVILDSLAAAAASLSISSIHISEFLRRLHNFVADIIREFSSTEEQRLLISEWSYRVIDEVFARDICVQISNMTTDQSDENISQISERFGELLLVQRSQLLKLGQTSGYNIGGILSEISLNDEEDSKEKFHLSYTPLVTTLQSYETFEEKYLALTGDAIKYFSIAGRPRAVDALSIDVALLDYQNKNYEKAVEVFATCPEFYGSQGWKLISKSLLEVYADCLEHLDESCSYFQNEEENSTSKSSMLCKVYLDIISSIKTDLGRKVFRPSYVDETFQKFEKLVPDDDIEYPASNLFDIKTIPYLLDSNSDTIAIEVEFKSPFQRGLTLKSAEVSLINENEEVFKFENKDLTINRGTNLVRFKAENIILGDFKFHQFKAEIGNVALVEKFTDNKPVFIFTYSNNTSIDIANSTNINLSTKSISLFLNIGDSAVKSSRVRLWSTTDGFEPITGIRAVNLSKNSPIELVDQDPDDLALSTNALEANSTYEIIIPYVINGALNPATLDLKAQMFYELESGERSQTVSKVLDTSFSIAVSVQDIFKNNGLYAKFSIGTADLDFPIRILSTQLSENDKYEVSTSLKAPPLIAFGEQPGSFFYKILKKEGVRYNESDYLTLDIRYRDLKEEMKQILRANLRAVLEKENLERYISLLGLVLDNLKYDYTHYVTDNEIKIVDSVNFDKKIADAIIPELKAKLVDYLEKSTTSVKVSDINDYGLIDRHLYINVQVPTVQVVHTVEFAIQQTTHHIVGDVIPAVLQISSFINGSTDTETLPQSKKRVQFESELSTSNVYSLEILNNQDSWLINGKTKFKFEIEKTQTNKLVKIPEINVSFIPLKVGKLALPKIKIINEGMDTKDEYLMEIDYKNENETLYIVSESINE